MSKVEKSIDVKAPVRTVYNQWTQFEEFPRFMEGVISIKQLDDKRLHWKTKIGGKEKDFDTMISEQIPDKRIAWHSTIGPKQAGVVTFHSIDPNTTRVMLQMEYEPEGVVENAGDMMGAVSLRISGDLDRFKKFTEQRGAETGAWRGEIRHQ
jgi:uncharacterized membrane protein